MKKLLCTLLAGLMLLPLVSCAQDPANSTLTTASPESGTATEGETVDPNYVCDLPDNLDFDDTEVNILYVDVDARSDELVSERLGLGSISDAVYERNLAVEQQLKVDLNPVEIVGDGEAATKIQTLVQGGDGSVDIFSLASWAAMPLVLGGHYLDLNQLEYVDTSKHYWSQDFNNIATYGEENMQFLATSPTALSLFRMAFLTIFNTELFEERRLPNLYEVVEKGEWTLDYQYRLTSGEYVDADGDGLVGEDDFYGFITGNYISLDGYCAAADVHITIRDEDGIRVYNDGVTEKMYDMVEKVSTLYNAPGTFVFDGGDKDNGTSYHIIEKFAEKEGLMATTQFLSLERRINMLADIGYGIVPMPKLTVQQQNYRTYVQDQVSAFGVSAAIGDANRQSVLGAVMEALAYHSNQLVRPVYYDTSMSLRFMQDPQSREMLDLMFEVLAFDYSFFLNLSSYRDDMRALLPSRSPNVASTMKKWQKGMKNQLMKDQMTLDKLSSN